MKTMKTNRKGQLGAAQKARNTRRGTFHVKKTFDFRKIQFFAVN